MRKGPLIASAATATYVLMATAVLVTHGRDPMAFVVPRPAEAPPERTSGIGYDGRFAYAIALDPCDAAQTLDKPAYRLMRIVYPLGARLLAMGQADQVPWALLAVNLASVSVFAFFLAELLDHRGVSPWLALGVVFSFNFLIGVRMDLSEPLAIALATWGLAESDRGRHVSALLLLVLAGLTKEFSLLFGVALGIWMLQSGRLRTSIAYLLLPLGVYLLWAGVVTAWLGMSPFGNPLARPYLVPFAGLRWLEPAESRLIALLWAVGPAVVVGFGAGWVILRGGLPTARKEAWLALASAALVAFLPRPTWIDPLAVLRLAIPVQVTGVLFLAVARPSVLKYAVALWTPSVLVAFLLPGFIT
jgi:hypothetical protein